MIRFGATMAVILGTGESAQAFDTTPEIAPFDVALRAVGTWVAPPELFAIGDGGSATIRRTAVLTETTESLLVEAFLDAAMTQPLLTYDSGGPMTVIGPWEVVPGAYAVELFNERSLVTAHVNAPEVWEAVNLGACGLEVGVAVDISDCADGPPFVVVDCVDLDMILLNADATSLRFGSPGTDRCVERPTSPSNLAFVRQ